MMIFRTLAQWTKTAVLGAFVAGSLAACGGGGGSSGDPVLGGGGGTGGGGTTPGVVASDLSIVSDKATIANDGTQTATITVTSLDGNRAALAGAPVSLSVNDPAATAFVTATTTTTDTSGKLTATLATGANRTNRSIVITATSGSVQRTVTVETVNPTSQVPLANDLSMVLDKISIGNTGSEKVTVTVTAVDAARNVVAGIPVAFTVDNKATVAVANGTTNAQGQAIATVQSGDEKSNRLITVTATSGTLVRTATFQVLGAKLTATAVGVSPAPGSAGNKVEYRLSDVNQNPMTSQPITVSAPGLPTVNGTTDANGAYVYTYTAPATPGPIDITAAAGGVTSVVTVTVPSNSSVVPPASATVVSASVAASPNVVSVNTASTTNRSELRALFLAANNAPVKNVRVRFDLDGNANNIDGAISAGNQLVYSDAGGVATSSYTPGGRSSPTNGVTIRACWDYTDFAANACPNAVSTTLTVVSDPLSVSIGTNEAIEQGPTELTYIKRFVLLVVDAAGNPKADVQITPSLDLTGYHKGSYQHDGTAWSPQHSLDGVSTAGISAVCRAEDLNKNGAIDSGEDRNGNNQLDPRKSDASITLVGATRTDQNGTAVLRLEYPKSVAGWVSFRITGSAAGVISPPAIYEGVLPVAADALRADAQTEPAFRVSPYGQRRQSSDAVYCTNVD